MGKESGGDSAEVLGEAFFCERKAELEQRVQAVDMLMKDGAIAALERRLHDLDKEVAHCGEERAAA